MPPNFLNFFVIPFSVPGCGSGIIDLTGKANRSVTITSPGYPKGYALNLNCVWTIECSPGEHLMLLVNQMDIYPSQSCMMEHLTVYSGIDGVSEWKEVGKLCAHNDTEQYLVATNFMKLNFMSNWIVNRTGFSVTVQKSMSKEFSL